jgi:tRNA nucleotidyltransferase (CCA-adding enzyme)
LVFNHIV